MSMFTPPPAKSRTILTPNGCKVRTRRTTAYVLVAYWNTTFGVSQAAIECGSDSLDKLRRRRKYQEFIVDMATGEVIR